MSSLVILELGSNLCCIIIHFYDQAKTSLDYYWHEITVLHSFVDLKICSLRLIILIFYCVTCVITAHSTNAAWSQWMLWWLALIVRRLLGVRSLRKQRKDRVCVHGCWSRSRWSRIQVRNILHIHHHSSYTLVVSYIELTAESKYDKLAKIKLEHFIHNPFVCHPPPYFIKLHQAELQ